MTQPFALRPVHLGPPPVVHMQTAELKVDGQVSAARLAPELQRQIVNATLRALRLMANATQDSGPERLAKKLAFEPCGTCGHDLDLSVKAGAACACLTGTMICLKCETEIPRVEFDSDGFGIFVCPTHGRVTEFECRDPRIPK